MYLKSTLCIAVLALLAGCGQQDNKTSASDKKPVELTVEQRLDLERTLNSKAAQDVHKIKDTPDCQPYADKVQAILSVAAEPAERKDAIDKAMGQAGKHGCLVK